MFEMDRHGAKEITEMEVLVAELTRLGPHASLVYIRKQYSRYTNGG